MDTKGSLEDLLGRGKPPVKQTYEPEEDGETLTIAEMSGATMRPANKNLTRIHVVLKDGSVCSFQYQFLGPMSKFSGNKFVLLFEGAKHWMVSVTGHGPEFWRAYDLATLHRLPYIREAAGNSGRFAGEGETVFTEVVVTDVTPKPE